MKLPAPSDGWRAFILILAALGAGGLGLRAGLITVGQFGGAALIGALVLLMIGIGIYES